MPSFIACAMTNCRWNRDGQCNKSEVFIDQGVMCSNYEPEVADLGLGLGAPGPDPSCYALATASRRRRFPGGRWRPRSTWRRGTTSATVLML